MEPPSPARLYASLTGALLVILGILGFFYSASFDSPGEVDDMLGIFAVNGWLNVIHIALGAIGLLVAGFAARSYSLWIGLLLIVGGAWGFVIGNDEAVLGFIASNFCDDVLHLVLGILGVAAATATPRRVAPAGDASSSASRAGDASSSASRAAEDPPPRA